MNTIKKVNRIKYLQITYKGLIFRIYKELLQLNNNSNNNNRSKQDLNRHFSTDIQMTNQHMKRYTT